MAESYNHRNERGNKVYKMVNTKIASSLREPSDLKIVSISDP